jgi:hypothetical protein
MVVIGSLFGLLLSSVLLFSGCSGGNASDTSTTSANGGLPADEVARRKATEDFMKKQQAQEQR